MINSVVIVGRVGQDPEVRYYDSGKVKTVLSVAVNRWAKDGTKTDWFRIELWDKKAEVAGEYAKKGKLVAIEGRLQAIVTEVTTNASFIALNEAQEEVNKLMQEVNEEIEFQITGQRPSCTHDCSTCGGSCSHNH